MDERNIPIFARLLAKKGGLDVPTMSFADLVERALENMGLEGAIHEVVCGPITTGGFGEPGLNTLLFNHAIELLALEGRPMFNQIPYEFQLARLERLWKEENGQNAYCHPILDEFYKPVFESGLIVRAWFLPGWEHSIGASWEHVLLSQLDIEVRYLPANWLYKLDVSGV